MKDEKVWDYSVCNIGGPCYHCIETCTFRKVKPTAVLNGQDEKENENERIIEESESGKQLYFNGEFGYYA